MWHWPILIYGRIIAFDNYLDDKNPKTPYCDGKSTIDDVFSWWIRLLLIGLTLLLATATLYLVEKPLRFAKSSRTPLLLGFGGFTLFVLGAVIGTGEIDVIDRPDNVGLDIYLPFYVAPNV